MSSWPTDYNGTLLFPLDAATGLPSGEPLAALDDVRGEWVRFGSGGRETRLPVNEDIRQITRRPGRKTGLFYVYGGEAGDVVGQAALGRRFWIAPPDQDAPQWWPFESAAVPTPSGLPASAQIGDFSTHARSLCAGLAGLDVRGPRGPLAPSQLIERSRQLLGPYSDVVGPRPPEGAMDLTFLSLGRSPDIRTAQLIAPVGGSHAVRSGGRAGFDPLRGLTIDPQLPWDEAERQLQDALGLSGEDAQKELQLHIVAIDAEGNFVSGRHRPDGLPEWSLGPAELPGRVFRVESAAPTGAAGALKGAALNASYLASRSSALRQDQVPGLSDRVARVAGRDALLQRVLPKGAPEALAEAGQPTSTRRRTSPSPVVGGTVGRPDRRPRM